MPPDPYRFADALEPELQRLYFAIIREAKAELPLPELAQAIDARDSAEVIRLVKNALGGDWTPQAATQWQGVLEEILGRTALREARFFQFSFDLFDPGVLGMVDQLTANRIRFVEEDALNGIRQIVRDGWLSGVTVREQGLRIRPLLRPPSTAVADVRLLQATIGLAPRHAAAVHRYHQAQLDAEVPPDLAIRNTELYGNRLLNLRALTIARTETITVANAGRVDTWRQMIADGFLEQDRMWLKWHVTDDDRLCPFCSPMDGQEVRYGSLFISSEQGFDDDRRLPRGKSLKPDPYSQRRDLVGRFAKAVTPRKGQDVTVPYPPLHPNCRCDVQLVLRDL